MVKTELRVIYGDTDQMGVVYYGNYLRYFEAGRTEWLRARGATYRDLEATHAIYLPVSEAKVSYKRPARYDDLITVETRLGELGRVSLRFDYRVLRGDEMLALGHTVHVCLSHGGDIRELPEAVLAQLRG